MSLEVEAEVEDLDGIELKVRERKEEERTVRCIIEMWLIGWR